MSLTVPELGSRRLHARPFGSSRTEPWAPVAIGLAGLAMAFLEPDPEVVWDDARVAQVASALEAIA
jgi:hypothetical protein